MTIKTFAVAAAAAGLRIIDHGDEGIFISAEYGDDRIDSDSFYISSEVDELAAEHQVTLEWYNSAMIGIYNG